MPRTATMPPAARGHQTLSAYISSRFDEFSRSQKDVGQYIVDHLDEVAFHTAEELARRASTSSSTVVRFSQALGFEGFPELQEAAREEYRHQMGHVWLGFAREQVEGAEKLVKLTLDVGEGTRTVFAGIAKNSPCAGIPDSVSGIPSVFTPTTSPARFNSGPPELPGLIIIRMEETTC
jgi:hypothetical protein